VSAVVLGLSGTEQATLVSGFIRQVQELVSSMKEDRSSLQKYELRLLEYRKLAAPSKTWWCCRT